MSNGFGFIRDKLQLKYLILFVLRQLKEPVAFSDLSDMAVCDGAIDYFEFADAVAELADSGHVAKSGGKPELYAITDKGLETADICVSDLPYSVRMAAQAKVLSAVSRLRREASITTRIEQRNGNPVLVLKISDGMDTLLSLELLTGTRSQAIMVETNFKKNAEEIFKAVLDALLKNYDGDNA